MSSHKKKSATPHGSHTSAPPIPELQGKLPGRVGLILQALQEKSQTLDSFEPTKSALETLLTPPKVQTEEDILNVLSATIGLPGTAGIAQGLVGGMKGAGRVLAGTLASNVPPKGGGKIKDLVSRRLEQIVKQANDKERKAINAAALSMKASTAQEGIGDALGILNKSKNPRFTELTRRRLRKQLDALEIEDPVTGKVVPLEGLDAEGLLELGDDFRKTHNTAVIDGNALEKEFQRLSELRDRLVLGKGPK